MMMTATEIVSRWERLKENREPDFSQPLSYLLYRTRRALLREAVQGNSECRMNYCIMRAITKPTNQYMTYGSVSYDPQVLARRAIWWYQRLERFASLTKQAK